MKRDLNSLANEAFDIAVIGGGITGAFVALEASLRGLSVALVEKGDFGAATSAASSKLLHGGVRYLQQGLVHKVRESAIERAHFHRLAPHLSHDVPFVVPTFPGISKSRAVLAAGMVAYETLCLGQNRYGGPGYEVSRPRMLTVRGVEEAIPTLDGSRLTGGVVFPERHMYSSERMTLAVLDTAFRFGAKLANYASADSIRVAKGKTTGIDVTDLLTGEALFLEASTVVNAAGPWITRLNSASSVGGRVISGFSKGAHIVVPSITRGHAAALATSRKREGVVSRGGRHLFVIPWRDHSLIGTSYCEFNGEIDKVGPSEADVVGLVEDVNDALGRPALSLDDVKFAYAGLYPLTREKIDPNVYQGESHSRIVDHHREDGVAGLISAFGAKFTTARLLAERTMRLLDIKAGRKVPLPTRSGTLHEGSFDDLRAFRSRQRAERSELSTAVVDQLVTRYGMRIEEVLANGACCGKGLSPLAGSVIEAEVPYAVSHEMAVKLDDFVFRRTGLGTLGHPGPGVLERCADLMGNILGWTDDRREAEIAKTVARFTLS